VKQRRVPSTVDAAEIGRRMERFRTACRGAGVALTPQRLEIFRAVAASTAHPDAETVFRRVRDRMPTLSLDTVYRTLWLLHDLGLVSTLGPRHESVRFDANLEPHHHFACVHCGLARDFTSPELDALRLPEAVRGFGTIATTRVEVRGLCDRCARQHAGRPADRHRNPPQGEERSRT
jgi:Fur family peroxide stress response transcriptional regulator